MEHVILTGASRGIGRALAVALAAPGRRLTLIARDRARLDAVARDVVARGAEASVVAVDFADLDAVSGVGAAAVVDVGDTATLIHNAGLWPSRCERVPACGTSLEKSFVVNHLAPLVLQRALLRRNAVDRVLVVSAGLIVKGRFDVDKTPVGADFSSLWTYAHTKLCGAVMARELGRARSDVDVTALHPGVVRTDLGDRGGLLGLALRFAKKKWEAPDVTAARLARVLALPRGAPGAPRWRIEEQEQPWPAVVDVAEAAVVDVTRRLIGDPFA